MAETVKFTEDELKQLTQNAETYREIQNKLGQLSYNKMVLEQQMNLLEDDQGAIEDEFKAAQQAEREFVKSLNDKYGPGTLNPETGEFTPAPVQEAAEDAPAS